MPNLVILDGRLTKDPEIRKTNNGSSVVNFVIAVNRRFKPKDGDDWKEEVSYFDVESFSPSVAKLDLKKGTHIYLEGSLRQDRWESNGEKRSKVKIKAERIHILSNGKKEAKEGKKDGKSNNS